jgi:hypothetical protein
MGAGWLYRRQAGSKTGAGSGAGLCKRRSTRRRWKAGGALHEPAGCPHRDSAQSVLAAMADEHARMDPLPAAVDTAFASPAQDRLADVSDALVTTLTS